MKKIIVANWKMNPATPKQAIQLFRDTESAAKGVKKAKIVIAAPFIFIPLFKRSRFIDLGAQDAFWRDSGPYTGEISGRMLKAAGVRYVVVGHSERREHLAETDFMINKKVKATLNAGLKVVLCVGERDRKDENFHRFVRNELNEDLKGISKKRAQNLVIAYEPIWAIGTGKTVKPQDLFEMVTYIRRSLLEIFGQSTLRHIPVLYGGSVNGANTHNFLEVDGVGGLLVGGASLSAKEFTRIIKGVK